MSDPTNLIVTGGAALGALGIIWAALRRTVRALVDLVRVVRELLELQPRVIELGERLVELVDHHHGHASRLDRLEAAVFPPDPLRKDLPHAA